MDEEIMDLVDEEETTEKTEEETAEETIEEEKELFDEDEVNRRVDKILGAKIARNKDKLRKEYDQKYDPYKDLFNVVSSALGTDSVEDATAQLKSFYEEKGVTIPERKRSYNDEDTIVLAQHEANGIIKAGMDEVIEEVDRLADIGINNMTARDKVIFKELADYRRHEENRQELLSEGAKEEIVDSDEFKEFASQFNADASSSKIYELYQKMNGQTEKPESIGSIKNMSAPEEKTFYTSEEVDRLTSEDLDNPKILERVMKSMAKW